MKMEVLLHVSLGMWQIRFGGGVTSCKGVLMSQEVLAEDKDTKAFPNGNKNASNQVQT